MNYWKEEEEKDGKIERWKEKEGKEKEKVRKMKR